MAHANSSEFPNPEAVRHHVLLGQTVTKLFAMYSDEIVHGVAGNDQRIEVGVLAGIISSHTFDGQPLFDKPTQISLVNVTREGRSATQGHLYTQPHLRLGIDTDFRREELEKLDIRDAARDAVMRVFLAHTVFTQFDSANALRAFQHQPELLSPGWTGEPTGMHFPTLADIHKKNSRRRKSR